ncbi:phenolpthiocerol synthesis type-I polyketide synthase ppsD [Mycobacterium tuberculosis]|nr:phenolpthiocerol synthesis type-I polyketide synthase ppsD [Mycobacterium tuberculosis]
MTSLAERAAQLSPNARAALARELVRAGTTFPTDIASRWRWWASAVAFRGM